MPAPRKPPGTRQDNRPARQRGALQVIRDVAAAPADGDPPEPPNPPGGLLASSIKAWADFFASKSAAGQDDVDHVVAARWITTLDEWQRSMNAVRRKRTVDGSKGQPVLNPLASWASTLAGDLHRLERQLGVGMRNRSDLGVSFGQAVMTAHQLNQMAAEEPDGDDREVIDVEEAEILAEFEEG